MPATKANSGSFKKGNPGRKKGSKGKKRRMLDAMGVKSWNDLIGWAEGPGVVKAIKEMSTLRGKDYVQAYAEVAEFVKPKLSRSEVLAKVDTNVTWVEEKTYADPHEPAKPSKDL